MNIKYFLFILEYWFFLKPEEFEIAPKCRIPK